MAGLRSNSSRIFISRNALQSTGGSRAGISLDKHVFSFVASVSPGKVLTESPPRQHRNKAFVNYKRKGWMTLMCKHNELRSFICRTSEPVSDLTGTFPEQKTLNHSWLSNFKQAAELVLNKPLSSLSGTTQSLRIATFTYTMTNKRVLRSQNTHYGSYRYKVSAFSDSFPFQVQEFVFADKDRGATATVAIAKRCERVLTKSSLWCFITADLICTLVRHGFLQIVRLTSKNRGICPSRLSKLSLCCLSTIPVLVRNNGRLSVTGEKWHWSPSTL